MSRSDLKRGLSFLDVARLNCGLVEKIFVEVRDAEREAAIHLLRGWRALGAFLESGKGSQQKERVLSDLLKELPIEEKDFPRGFPEEQWRDDLLKLEGEVTSVEPVDEGQILGLKALERHHLLLFNTEQRLRKKLYRDCGLLTPTQKFWRILGTLVLLGVLAFGIYWLLKPVPAWRAFFFNGQELAGEPIKEARIEILERSTISAPQATGVPETNYSAEISACLTLEDTFPVDFELGSDDGSRLYINGEKIIENWRTQGHRVEKASTVLAQGQHLIKIEYMQGNGPKSFSFEMKSRKQPLLSFSGASLSPAIGERKSGLSCR